MLSFACLPYTPAHAQSQNLWYSGTAGIASNDPRLINSSIPYHVRERYQASSVQASRTNSWIVWASAWSDQDDNGSGRVYITSLELYGVDKNGNEHPIQIQTWGRGQEVTGGCYRYTTTDWFGDQVDGPSFFIAGAFMDTNNVKQYGARIDTSEVEDVPAVCHIWQSRWPRDTMPEGTVKIRVKATFAAFGDALVNVGLDRYRTNTLDDRPVQEVLVSDTYSAQEGLVRVAMDTAPIDWIN